MLVHHLSTHYLQYKPYFGDIIDFLYFDYLAIFI